MATLHPVLNAQAALNGGGQVTQEQDGILDDLGGVIDTTPRFLAGMLLGALATLILLRVAGFRFSFGVGVGGGSS